MAGRLMKRKAFTLIELMVVVGVVAILAMSVGAAVNQARSRARIARAEAEVNEMTNAIRAYENYIDVPLKEMRDEEATESSIDFLLGKGKDRDGKSVPVLFNAQLTGRKVLDPWGLAYRVRIVAISADDNNQDGVASALSTGVYLPNRYRSNRRDNP